MPRGDCQGTGRAAREYWWPSQLAVSGPQPQGYEFEAPPEGFATYGYWRDVGGGEEDLGIGLATSAAATVRAIPPCILPQLN
jgi:hypothetical protein